MKYFLSSVALHSLMLIALVYQHAPEPKPAPLPMRVKIVEKIITTAQPQISPSTGSKKKKPYKASKKISRKAKDLSDSVFDPKSLTAQTFEENLANEAESDGKHYSGGYPEKHLREQPYLQKFAADLYDYFRFPPYLRENSSYLYGWVRVKRLGRDYVIQKFSGTPYGRALVYETVREVLKRDVYTQPLRQGNIKRFEVHFLFRTQERNEAFRPPPAIYVADGRITLNEYKFGPPSPLSRYIMAGTNPTTGLAAIGPNVLAPLFDVIEFFSKEDEKIPADVKALRVSKAFRRRY